MPLLQEDGPDTALARALHDAGVVPLETLRACLQEVRAAREAGAAASLAALLLSRGLTTAAALERAAKGPGAVASPPAATPRRLGPYRLLRELARGGMGAVHEAVHEPTGAVRAVKTLLGLDADGLLRFRTEVEALARLDHPHVARVHEACLTEEPRWLAQDLLPGGTLQDRLARGPLAASEATRLAAKLARALQHAHEHGVLHRDVKPANVLFDERGEPRLADFGLARCVDRATRVTAAGTLMGTPIYMAPEQARGDDVDARADIYALGVVLWALLVGRPPFEEGSTFAVLEQVLHAGIPPLRGARPDVSPGLAAVVDRATALEPAARHPTAAALADDLERVLAGQAPAPAPRRARRLRGRRGVALGAGAALVVSAAVVVAWAARPAAPAGTAAGPAASVSSSRPVRRPPRPPLPPPPPPYEPPQWLIRLDGNGCDATSFEGALVGAPGADAETRRRAIEVLRKLDAEWQAPGEGDSGAAFLQLLRIHRAWVALDARHRMPEERLRALRDGQASLGDLVTEFATMVRVGRMITEVAPQEVFGYQLYDLGAGSLDVSQRDVELLLRGADAAREAGEPEAAATLQKSAAYVLTMTSLQLGPDEGLARLGRAEALGYAEPVVHRQRALLLQRRFQDSRAAADIEAALAAAERHVAAQEALPPDRRELQHVHTAWTVRAELLADAGRFAEADAALQRGIAVEPQDSRTAGLALRRFEPLRAAGADEATLRAAIEDLAARLERRIAKLDQDPRRATAVALRDGLAERREGGEAPVRIAEWLAQQADDYALRVSLEGD